MRTPSYACKPMGTRVVARPATSMVQRTFAWSFANGHGIVRPRGCGGSSG